MGQPSVTSRPCGKEGRIFIFVLTSGVEATELTYLVKSGTTSLPKVSVPVVVVDVKRGEGDFVVTVQGVAGVPVKQILQRGYHLQSDWKMRQADPYQYYLWNLSIIVHHTPSSGQAMSLINSESTYALMYAVYVPDDVV